MKEREWLGTLCDSQCCGGSVLFRRRSGSDLPFFNADPDPIPDPDAIPGFAHVGKSEFCLILFTAF